VLLLILGLSCTSSSPVWTGGLIEADTLMVGLLVVVGTSSLVAMGVNRDAAGADVVINFVVGPILITDVILVVIDTGDCPVDADVIVIDGSPGVMVDIGTGDCPVVADVIVTDGSPGVVVGIGTGDVIFTDGSRGPGPVFGTGDCPEVVVDITTGDCPGDVVIVDREIGDCPLEGVVTGPGDCDGEGVVSIGDIEGRPVGAASHWEKVSEVLESVAWKQN